MYRDILDKYEGSNKHVLNTILDQLEEGKTTLVIMSLESVYSDMRNWLCGVPNVVLYRACSFNQILDLKIDLDDYGIVPNKVIVSGPLIKESDVKEQFKNSVVISDRQEFECMEALAEDGVLSAGVSVTERITDVEVTLRNPSIASKPVLHTPKSRLTTNT